MEQHQVIDLTHPIRAGMPVYPGTPPVEITEAARLDSDGFNELRLALTTHTGTHLDTPYHLLADGADLSGISPAQCIGTAVVIDLRDVPSGIQPGPGYFRPFEEQIRGAEFVLILTGWSRFWGSPAYFSGFPVPDPEAARYLASFSLKGIGIDALSFDPPDSVDLPVHHILLGKGLILI
jgi:kynurenine formamidase